MANPNFTLHINDSQYGAASTITPRVRIFPPRADSPGHVSVVLEIDGCDIALLVSPGALHTTAAALGRLADEFSQAVEVWRREHDGKVEA